MKKIISALLTLSLLTSAPALQLQTLADSTSVVSQATLSEWSLIAALRNPQTGADRLSRTERDSYYAELAEFVKSKKGVLHKTRSTEYSRTILAVAALGRDPRNVGGYDLLIPLADFDFVVKQGLNGAVWALIALDSGIYDIPSTDAKNQTTRARLVDYILSRQNEDGSFAGQTGSEADYTAMALQALANYCTRSDVSEAIAAAVDYLSKAQNKNGGFSSRWGESSETTSQAIIALCTVGIPLDDKRFVKDKSLADNLASYKVNGGYAHNAGGKADGIATEQAELALCAVERFNAGKNALYDYSDTTSDVTRSVGDVRVPAKLRAVTFPDLFCDGSNTATPDEVLASTIILASPIILAIESLSARGIINGREDGCFHPNDSLTRAEFAAIIVRALGLPKTAALNFTDVDPDSWSADYIAAASSYKLINGVGGGCYNPDGTITREETAAIIARAAKLCGLDTSRTKAQTDRTLSKFADSVRASDWARGPLAFCCDTGLIDELRPTDAVTRAEAAEMIYKLLGAANLM